MDGEMDWLLDWSMDEWMDGWAVILSKHVPMDDSFTASLSQIDDILVCLHFVSTKSIDSLYNEPLSSGRAAKNSRGRKQYQWRLKSWAVDMVNEAIIALTNQNQPTNRTYFLLFGAKKKPVCLFVILWAMELKNEMDFTFCWTEKIKIDETFLVGCISKTVLWGRTKNTRNHSRIRKEGMWNEYSDFRVWNYSLLL